LSFGKLTNQTRQNVRYTFETFHMPVNNALMLHLICATENGEKIRYGKMPLRANEFQINIINVCAHVCGRILNAKSVGRAKKKKQMNKMAH